MALGRIRRPEGLRHIPPGELGKVAGLDRVPEVRTLREKVTLMAQTGRPQAWMQELAGNNLPIAATNTPFFLQLQFYAPPMIRSRVIYLVSRKYAMEFDGSDTGDDNMVHFSRRVSLPLVDYDAFVAKNPHFMVCADTASPTWLTEKLLKDGASLRLRKREGFVYVYEVYYQASDATSEHNHK